MNDNPTQDEWELIMARVFFDGIRHKLDNGIPLTDEQKHMLQWLKDQKENTT